MKDYNILRLQELMDSGELTSVELTQHYIDRINEYDVNYNSVFEVNEEAISIAASLDEERREKGKRSLLHGIPVMLKDNINVDCNKKLHTTAGSIILKDFYANYDAFIVKKLKESGAIILGKTNLTEFANFISEDSPNGYSALSGQVVNPYGPFDVGGSSSGSGVAAALGLCQVAIGTETSGSIISPATSNSVVGIKPTVGLVSRHGIIPISWTQDIAGPMTRNVIDAAITLSIIQGKDDNDASTLELKDNHLPAYLDKLNRNLKGIKIGVPQGSFIKEADEDTVKVFEKALENLEKLGAEVIKVNIKEDIHDPFIDVLFYEFPIALESYFNIFGDYAPIHTLEEIVEFNKADPEVRIPYDQKVFERSLELKNDYKTKYEEELRNSIAYGKKIDKVMEESNVDVLVFVDTMGADIAARVGYPSVTVPAGYTDNNKPVGLTFTAKKFSEDRLLSYAYAYECAYPERKDPLK